MAVYNSPNQLYWTDYVIQPTPTPLKASVSLYYFFPSILHFLFLFLLFYISRVLPSFFRWEINCRNSIIRAKGNKIRICWLVINQRCHLGQKPESLTGVHLRNRHINVNRERLLTEKPRHRLHRETDTPWRACTNIPSNKNSLVQVQRCRQKTSNSFECTRNGNETSIGRFVRKVTP